MKKWFKKHPIGGIVIMFLTVMALIPILLILPEWTPITISAFLCAVMVISVIWIHWKEKKEKESLKNMTRWDMKEKWKKYVSIVNVTLQKQEKSKELDDAWIEHFQYLMQNVAGNTYYINRVFNDFDIASFLIYSLTFEHREKEDILFAFECAKPLMKNPKEYTRRLNLGGEVSLQEKDTILEVKKDPFDEKITEEMAITMIERYLQENSADAIVQLSDFLSMLYRKS